MKITKYLVPAAFLFLFFLPSFEMSHAGQIQNLDTHASEVAKTANPSVGSGGWIGSFFAAIVMLILMGSLIGLAACVLDQEMRIKTMRDGIWFGGPHESQRSQQNDQKIV